MILFEDLLVFLKVKGSSSVINNISANLNIFKKSSNSNPNLTKKDSIANISVSNPDYNNAKYVFDDEHELHVKYYSHYNLKSGNCIVFEHGNDTTKKMEKIELSCLSEHGKSTVQYVLEFPGDGFDGKLDAWYAELIHYIDQATNKIIE